MTNIKRALGNYFLANDIKRDLENSPARPITKKALTSICSTLPNFASAGAAYALIKEPYSALLAVGAIELLRVYARSKVKEIISDMLERA